MILVDTHVVVWLALDPARVSARATAEIHEARKQARGLAIAGISLYEIAVLASKERIALNTRLEVFLRDVEMRFVVLPITSSVCISAANLSPDYPRDPVDRLIGATALAEGLPLVTADRAIQRSRAIRTIW